MPKPLILLVEDSPTQAKEVANNLMLHGCDVMVVENGLQALRLIDANDPALIVLDVNLPGMNGLQVCHRVKRDPDKRHIPIIMLTVADSTEDTLAGLEAGANDYIPKDVFAHENLLATLRALGIELERID